mgnify:CR=1 FL=1
MTNKQAQNAPDLALQHEVEQFLFRQSELLDNKRYADWLDLFALDGAYWIPADIGQTDPLIAPSHVYERRPVLDARVLRPLAAEK